MTISIDGKSAAAHGTVLEACRAAGASVPAFCHDDRLDTGAHCRACMVEVDGRMVAACSTPARDGQVVHTVTERVLAYRRDLGELMASEAAPGGAVGRVLDLWGVRGERYGSHVPSGAVDTTHPYLRISLDACIRCRRCVDVCEQVEGRFVYSMQARGEETHLGWGGGAFEHSACAACGACASVCPTGAITDVDRLWPAGPASVRSTCGYCGVGCQIRVYTDGRSVQRVDGVDSPVNHGHLCVKGRFAHGFVHHPDRLTRPLVRKDGVLVPVSWDEAIRAVADGFAACGGKVAALASSRCTNEENYLLQKWFRGGFGTNDVDCCARVCHAPSAAGMRVAFGTGAATSSLEDIEKADLIFVVGANPTEAHPITGARIAAAARRGAGLIVIDPRTTDLARLADVHLAVRPGGNVPLLNAIAAVIVEEDLVDHAFVAARVDGYEALVAALKSCRPEATAALTGLPPGLVREAARRFASAERVFLCHGLGVTEHLQGSEAVMLLCNLALLTGNVGKPGAGVNPLRGQNNVQGAADMGCQPDLLTGYRPVSDPAVRAAFAAVWGREVPEAPGRTLPEMYDAMISGDLHGLFVLGEDLVQTDPNRAFTEEALGKLKFMVVQELFLTDTARMANVVLPAASFFEKDGTFTNGERRIQRVRRVVDPVEGARPDWRVLLSLMEATGWPQPFHAPSEVMAEVARVSPAYAGVSYSRLEGDGLQWPVPTLDSPGTRTLHPETFPIGRGQLSVVTFVPSPDMDAGLVLITGRVLEHYNCGTMTRRTSNVDLQPEDVLEIAASDARARGIHDGDSVRIVSRTGEVSATAKVSDRMKAGTVFLTFHFPETKTNALIGDVRDRMTGCPEYKITAVDVRPERRQA